MKVFAHNVVRYLLVYHRFPSCKEKNKTTNFVKKVLKKTKIYVNEKGYPYHRIA